MGLKRDLNAINLVDEAQDWKIFGSAELKQMQKMGVLSADPKNSANAILSRKSIYQYLPTGEIFILKKNLFKDSHDNPLETSTAVNEFMLDKLITKVAENPKFAKLREIYLPVDLIYVFHPSAKSGKPSKNVCSSTKYLEGWHNKKILEIFYPDIFNSIDTSTYPNVAKLFIALVGKRNYPDDVLYNDKGEVRMIDLADSNPLQIDRITIPLLFQRLDAAISKEEMTVAKAIALLEDGIEMLKIMIANAEVVKQEVYSVYNKINLDVNIQQGRRPTGLKLYTMIWEKALVLLQNKINALNGDSASCIDPIKVLNVQTILSNVEQLLAPVSKIGRNANKLVHVNNPQVLNTSSLESLKITPKVEVVPQASVDEITLSEQVAEIEKELIEEPSKANEESTSQVSEPIEVVEDEVLEEAFLEI